MPTTETEPRPERATEREPRADAQAPAKPTRPKRHPRPITLRVSVPWIEYHMVKQAAKSLADDGLAEVLAAFVSDWVVAQDRPGSWEADRVNAWLASHPWPKIARAWEARWQAQQAAEAAGKGGA
jgi:hypothetical protein